MVDDLHMSKYVTVTVTVQPFVSSPGCFFVYLSYGPLGDVVCSIYWWTLSTFEVHRLVGNNNKAIEQ